MRKLLLLFKLRTWMRSKTLSFGGVLLALGEVQLWLQSSDGVSVAESIANMFGWTGEALIAVMLHVVGLGVIGLRLVTTRSVEDK